MKVIRLKEENCLTDKEADKLAGEFLDDSHYDILVDKESCKVYKPDGTPLLVFIKKAIPSSYCKVAYDSLRRVSFGAGNRGLAGGKVKTSKMGLVDRREGKNLNKYAYGKKVILDKKALRLSPIKKDGTRSRTQYAAAEVPSGVIGYFDRYPRIPYCRMTAFNLHKPKKFKAALPFIRKVDKVFKKYMRKRWKAQMEVVKNTSKDFVIHGTAFTTITVNRNWTTATHKDIGDLKAGFGVMTALRGGKYKGCYLVFPKFRVAVNMSTRDVLLADVHEWHGNTPLVGITGAYERISCVLYYRENMQKCGSAKEEEKRAKNRKLGDPMY